MYRPIFSSLVVLTLAVAFANTLTNPPQRFSRQHSELPDYDVYRIQEKRRVDVQHQQQQQQQPVLDQPPEEDDNATLLQTRLAKVSVLRDEHPFSESKRNAPGFMTEALKFIQANQVVFYVACSCVLIGVALLFTLVTVYGGCGSARKSMGSIRARGEAHPLLGSSRNLFAKSGLNDSDEMSTCVGDEELDTRARIMSTPEVSPIAQCSGVCDVVLPAPQPIAVFPHHLLDLCNQDKPLSFAAFLPNGNHDRSKWLAHGGHSEVFQVVSLLRRTILKIVPVMKAFTRDEVETLTLGIEASLKLSTLRYGMQYRASNFVEVQRIQCVYDRFPEWLLKSDAISDSSDSLAESLASELAGKAGPAFYMLAAFRQWKGTNQCCLTRHFIIYELCYAGKPLSQITLRSAEQGRSLIQQASCCVAVAERALGFRHLTVDADKLLVTPTDSASLEYRFLGRQPVSVATAGLKAHIAGSLSFVVSMDGKGEDYARGLDSFHSSPSSDCSGRSPRFYSNVMWLGSVLDCVVLKLRSEVPETRALVEKTFFDELHLWQNQLLQCSSVDEFVAATHPI